MRKIIFLLCLVSSFAYGQDGILKTLKAEGTDSYTISEALPNGYNSKERFLVRFSNANTGVATLNRAALGAKNLLKAGGVSLSAGDIKADGIYLISYNGAYYQIVGDGSGSGGGSGTVTSVSVTTANGVSGTVATATTTPAISLTLGAITPTTVNGVTLSGSSTPALAVTGTSTISGTHSGTSSGTNTGDQTNITGNAATVTTNANLTGHVTSTGNAAVLGSFTVAQLSTAISDANISGTNTGDQTSIVGITGSLAEFNTALTGADFATGGGTATGTNTGDQTYYAPTTLVTNATDADFTATANGVHNILDGVASTNRVITIPVGSNGNVIKFYNTEDTYTWSFTGATVYLADRVTVQTSLLYNVPCHMEKIDGLWIITN